MHCVPSCTDSRLIDDRVRIHRMLRLLAGMAAGSVLGLAGVSTARAVDTDFDGIDDDRDNCVLVANGPLLPDAGGHSQRDTDRDGFGNLCDPDFNDDLSVDFADLAYLRQHFFSSDADGDLTGDSTVDFADLAVLKSLFFGPPGPAASIPLPPPSTTSINSTSQNGFPAPAVPEQAFTGTGGYQVFGSNDLGMHCGDFDTRISSILPPFNVLHGIIIRRGDEPDILTPDDNVELVYTAASNPNDPILTGINSAGDGPVLWSTLDDGSVFKNNFWDIAREAYDPFYPPDILPAFYPPASFIADLGLPVPNVERLYLGDGTLTAEQQSMPGRFNPYVENTPQLFKTFTTDQPFFLALPFGYTARKVNWFEAAGAPASAFDDAGRENPWPLFRLQARNSSGTVLASSDVVAPISGEANCGFCHNDAADGGNGAAIQALIDAGLTVTVSLEDPQHGRVPQVVSEEWAADVNLLRLHDLNNGTSLIIGTTQDDPPGPTPFQAVVCQSCHYTPALDLAHVGPKGPADGDANGRQQTNVRSMSNVMHSHHATVRGLDGELLFPDMPPAVDSSGKLRNPVAARDILMQTCYQCHPGRRTDCLRGAMASGGMLCQDCHGQMAQVGDDFSKFVTPDNPGDFRLASDFYTNPATLRVPWANEPGCGSCHTGDAMNNLHSAADTLGSPSDNIRLMQAYRIGDTGAKPIVPGNRRFAEDTVPATDPGAGNPMLYRVSTGHEGVYCEACHGATHGIWPNKNPRANDNVTATQLQGHAGVVIECDTCHTDDLGNTLEGPHGMHPVGAVGRKFADGGHEDLAEHQADSCRACHGQNGEGTVLSTMHQDRILDCDEPTAFCPDGESQLFPKGYQVTCSDCHDNEL